MNDQLLIQLEKISIDSMLYLSRIKLPSNPAIVFDIDGTILSHTHQPIEPILRIYHYAISQGITPFIVTSRLGIPVNVTYTNSVLQSIGIYMLGGAYYRPEYVFDQFYYKLKARENIEKNLGYNVVMSIGDNWWDIGEYGGQGVIVPRI